MYISFVASTAIKAVHEHAERLSNTERDFTTTDGGAMLAAREMEKPFTPFMWGTVVRDENDKVVSEFRVTQIVVFFS